MLTNIKDPSVRYPVRAKRGFIQNYKQGNAAVAGLAAGMTDKKTL